VEFGQLILSFKQLIDVKLKACFTFQLINFELAKEAEDLREDVPEPLSIEDLEGAADIDSDNDDDDGDDDDSSIE
jgi:hypothetical protein